MAISLVNVVGGLYTWLTTDSDFKIVETKEAGPRACMDINDKLRDRLSRQTFTITGATMLAAALGVERGPVNVDQAYVQTVDYLIRGFAS